MALAVAERMWSEGKHQLPEMLREECLRLTAQTAEAIVLCSESVIGIEVMIALDASGKVVPFDSPEAAVRGKIDRLETASGDNGPLGVVWDLKSGRVIDNPSESKQLALYGALAKRVVDLPLVGRLYYPRYNVEREAPISDRRAEEALAWAMHCRDQIIQCSMMSHWPESPGRGCRDCPRFWQCETRGRLFRGEPVVPMDEDAAARLMREIDIGARMLSERRDLLRLWVERNGPLAADGLYADLTAVHRYRWHMGKLVDLLQNRGLDYRRFIKADNQRLKKEAARDPGLAALLADLCDDRSSTKLDIRGTGQEPAKLTEEE